MQISSTNHILIADSDQEHRRVLTDFLEGAGHRVSSAANGADAVELLGNNVFQLAIVELELPGVGGLEVLQGIQDQTGGTPVIMTTGSGSLADAVEAMRLGAFDFREKPLNLEHLQLTVDRALERASLTHAFDYLRHEQPYLYRLDSITAESPAMQQVLRQVSRLAPTNMTVLVTGETGTGKSLIAGAIHANSPRRDNTLVTVNCAALTETLLESELFGHEKGAFTGAHKARDGRFQQAHGGTLFLDEVGEMSPAVQAKVLRAIDEQVIYRLGGAREIHVNVRILAATNRDLGEEVRSGQFRMDLFYRLNVAPLHIPPLAERRADILPLAERFLGRISAEMNRTQFELTDDAREALLNYNWPGNIRELRNVIERTALFAESTVIKAADLGIHTGDPLTASSGEPRPRGLSAPAEDYALVSETLDLEELEKKALVAALEKSDWVQKDAARLLGITDRRMTYKLNKFQISHPKFRTKRRRTPAGAERASKSTASGGS